MGTFSEHTDQPEQPHSIHNSLRRAAALNQAPDNAPAPTAQKHFSTPAPPTTAQAVRGKRRNASRWTLADIEWNRIDHERIRNDPTAYYEVTAASFVETAADLYTTNLVEHFPDPKARHWLVNHWQPEELQHGLALRTYVETVWPELNWQRGYQGFLAEYSQMCTMDELENSRALEMVARCVVETGTSTLYTTLNSKADEPVLKTLTNLIRQDEVSHYNHFRHFFEAYQEEERIGRVALVRSLYKRFTEAENEDALVGLKHAWLMRHPDMPLQEQLLESVTCELRAMLRKHYPYRMALKMLLQPLALNRTLVNFSLPVLEGTARRLMFKG
jgi:hypothetical protein